MAKASGMTRRTVPTSGNFTLSDVRDGVTIQGYLAKQKGFEGKPHVVSASDFTTLAGQDGNIVVYRGYRNDEEANIRAFKYSNDVYQGSGGIGEGHYFSPQTLAGFSNSGKYVEAIIQPSKMKIADYNKLYSTYEKERDAYRSRFTFDDYSKLKTKQDRDDFSLRSKYYDDFGRWATIKGYDAIKGDNEYVVLNRKNLIVKR